jgi:hypothetical protein
VSRPRTVNVMVTAAVVMPMVGVTQAIPTAKVAT